jgi:hypothetical protein
MNAVAVADSASKAAHMLANIVSPSAVSVHFVALVQRKVDPDGLPRASRRNDAPLTLAQQQ